MNICLQVETYDDNSNCTVVQFEVEEEWLKSHIEQPLEEFLNEYTSDESSFIHSIALFENAILKEKKLED